MTWSHPAALLWGLLAIPVVLLYLWRLRSRRQPVATGFLWEQVFAGRGTRSRWRHPASLVLQLLILALLVAALAEPHWRPPRRVVLVIDNSASMNATDLRPTRLDQAKRWARQWLATLSDHDQVAVISAGQAVRVCCGWTGCPDRLAEVIERIRPTTGSSCVTEAVDLAQRLIADRRQSDVIVLSDGCFDGAKELANRSGAHLVALRGKADNLMLSRLSARRAFDNPRCCQVLVEVAGFTAQPVSCDLELRWNGRRIDTASIRLTGAGRWEHVFQMKTAEPGQVSARINRPDDLNDDNEASVQLPACPIHRVALAGGANPCLEKAIAANPRAQRFGSDNSGRSGADVIHMFCGQVPRTLPLGPVLVIQPQDPCDLWELGPSIEEPVVASQAAELSLLQDVRLEGSRLAEAKQLVLAGEAKSAATPIVWTSDRTALAYAINRPGGRVVVLAGKLETSGLVDPAALPILLANALDWVAAIDQAPSESLSGIQDSTPRLDRRESDLGQTQDLPTVWPVPAGPPLWAYLAGAALVLLVVEWGLFQRRWTC